MGVVVKYSQGGGWRLTLATWVRDQILWHSVGGSMLAEQMSVMWTPFGLVRGYRKALADYVSISVTFYAGPEQWAAPPQEGAGAGYREAYLNSFGVNRAYLPGTQKLLTTVSATGHVQIGGEHIDMGETRG